MVFLTPWLAFAFPFLAVGQDYNPEDFIHSQGASNWGFWGQIDTCPEGSYTYGFELKLESEHGFTDDDTSINAIQLFCRKPNGEHVGEITSSTMNRGSWRGSLHCHSGYLSGYDLKSHTDTGAFVDQTGANALRMYCTTETDYIEDPGNKWGHWLGDSHCREGMAICGILTLVQDDQGAFTDDSALNDVRFKCCDLPA